MISQAQIYSHICNQLSNVLCKQIRKGVRHLKLGPVLSEEEEDSSRNANAEAISDQPTCDEWVSWVSERANM